MFLKTNTGRRYSVHFITDPNGDIIIESIFSKSADCNDKSKLLSFYQALMGYNPNIPYISFGLIEFDDIWHIVLNGSVSCGFLRPETVYDILNIFDLAYSVHLPKIEDIAEELGLNFTGKLDRALKDLIKGILED